MIKKTILSLCACLSIVRAMTQTPSPVITCWLQNTLTVGSYYTSGNSNTITNNILVNCQKVEYSSSYVYVSTKGIPSYPTGPFLDGNPSQASNQNAIFKIPFTPTPNTTGTLTSTTGGDIGVFINGVALFDYRDGVSWNNAGSKLCGGPIQPPCMGDGVWNRDAVPAEKAGFDCSKGHPAMGNYHHHQNPSAFKLDATVISTVCSLYDANGLYVMNTSQHSPLIGFAYDGYPIYGAFAYKNTDGTGGVTRMKSGYQLRTVTTRTSSVAGATVTPVWCVSTTYPLGYFREDYQYVTQTGQPDYLDDHNGRFCVTPEYPNGTYAYFCTVDVNLNSAYPYVVGPYFYGVYANRQVTSVTETTTVYAGLATGISETEFKNLDINIFPNPAQEMVVVQVGDIVRASLTLDLMDMSGKRVARTYINKGSTIASFDLQTVYEGIYMVKISSENFSTIKKIVVKKD